MINKFFGAVCVVVLVMNISTAQPSGPTEATNWGKSVQGVQLSISVTNNVFRVGSSTTVASVTKNSSTNDITVDISAPTVEFDVLLTNGLGKLYHVTTPMAIREPRQLVTIKPGGESFESIPVTFGETRLGDTVEPGDYTLLAMRYFSLSRGRFALVGSNSIPLESNPIKVRIIK
jgi:hypothetical protein